MDDERRKYFGRIASSDREKPTFCFVFITTWLVLGVVLVLQGKLTLENCGKSFSYLKIGLPTWKCGGELG